MDEIVSMAPVNFFQLCATIQPLPQAKKGSPSKGASPFLIDAATFSKYKLPDTSKFCNETPFAKVAMGWSKEGIEISIHADVSDVRCSYPNFNTGDSVEIMIDTRDVKTSGYNTRFCHHFFFLPEAIDGVQCGEITRFRTEDTHELCDPKDLQMKIHQRSESYQMSLFIPAHCLFGYDPEQFNRMGFTYRINASTHLSQHFSVLGEEFQIEQQPSLWASLTYLVNFA